MFIYDKKSYKSYSDMAKAMGGDGIPAGVPVLYCYNWQIMRDGDGNAVLFGFSEDGIVLGTWHAYYDTVQEMWRWQV